jgi:uncharacterized protein (TIGR02679 family)
VTGNPHALDHDSFLAGVVLAILGASGRLKPRQKPRAAWDSIGVDCDDVVGGIVALEILPVGWAVPRRAPVTLCPRVLSTCTWPSAPSPGSWVFVTENPSILSAAADLPGRDETPRVLCTNGTPSGIEIAAIARLADAGWSVAVRADFDLAGLAHVTALLEGIPSARPWRMGAHDYLESLNDELAEDLVTDRILDTPWAPELALAMRKHRRAAYEEALTTRLLGDVRRGTVL